MKGSMLADFWPTRIPISFERYNSQWQVPEPLSLTRMSIEYLRLACSFAVIFVMVVFATNCPGVRRWAIKLAGGSNPK